MEERRKTFLRLGTKQFGPPDAVSERVLQELMDLARLEALSDRLLDVATWSEWMVNS